MKRLPAFSLLEISIVLLIVGGTLATVMPLISRFQKQYEIRHHMDIAMKSLGAYVAMNGRLPLPEPIKVNEDFIVRGDLPYKELGIPKKRFTILYAADKNLTDQDTHINTNFCKIDWPKHFDTKLPLENDLIAFELSVDKVKIAITRNNFVAQYCGTVCKNTVQVAAPLE